MILESLKLTDYRNISNLECLFDPKINVIYGLNGQGKTNLIESIDFLSSLKSFRNDPTESLVKLESKFAVIEARFKEMSIKYHARLVLSLNGTKIKFNNQDLKRNSDFIGLINVITFSPSDVSLFKDSPKRRREFIDDEISKMSPTYYHLLLEYKKILKERNELLKQDEFDKLYFEVITKKYAELNVEIMKKRYQFIDNLNVILEPKFKEVSKIEKEVLIRYETYLEKEQITFENVYKKIKEAYESDLKYRATQVGIHHDDLRFLMDNNDVATFASQGQSRLCIIATKLALLDVSYKQTGSRAIVVFDDVLSELDKVRQTQILNHVPKENQIFITTAQTKEEIKHLFEGGKMLRITDGCLETEE